AAQRGVAAVDVRAANCVVDLPAALQSGRRGLDVPQSRQSQRRRHDVVRERVLDRETEPELGDRPHARGRSLRRRRRRDVARKRLHGNGRGRSHTDAAAADAAEGGEMKRTFLAAALLFVASLANAASVAKPVIIENNASCELGHYPAATLLLPYFEVDYRAASSTAV